MDGPSDPVYGKIAQSVQGASQILHRCHRLWRACRSFDGSDSIYPSILVHLAGWQAHLARRWTRCWVVPLPSTERYVPWSQLIDEFEDAAEHVTRRGCASTRDPTIPLRRCNAGLKPIEQTITNGD